MAHTMKNIKHIIFVIALLLIGSGTIEATAPSFKSWMFKPLYKNIKEVKANKKAKKLAEAKNSGDSGDSYTEDGSSEEWSDDSQDFSAKKKSKNKGGGKKSSKEAIEAEANEADLEELIQKYPNYKTYGFSEQELEWNEFNDKKNKLSGRIVGDEFILKSEGREMCNTFTDLPINTNGDFVITADIMFKGKAKDLALKLGINMEDANNLGVIDITDSQITYTAVKDNKTGRQQTQVMNQIKDKNPVIHFKVERKEGIIVVYVNGDDVLKIRKIDYENSGLGIYCQAGQEITILQVGCGFNNPED